MKPPIAVAVSGGVDSLVAAQLIKDNGNRVFGLHFLTGYESTHTDVAAIGDQLGIAVHVVNLQDDFRTEVVDYFLRTYRAGKTPNPCLVCNPVVKFGVLFEHARRRGAERLATGHYARISPDDRRRRPHLLRGTDLDKDQSYFLAFLTPHQLKASCFPLGEMTKSEVTALATARGLRPVADKESQDACFIGRRRYTEFLTQKLGMAAAPGDIVDRDGRVLGRHPGLHRYTIGQRRGIDCPAADPYYVLRLDTRNNRLVVGSKADTLSARCRVERLNWIRPKPAEPIRVRTRVRYRHRPAPSLLTPLPRRRAVVDFDRPQSALTPGQGAVFYDGEEVIGAGWIA
jgi:tRNA-specific 2-thiouridylase